MEIEDGHYQIPRVDSILRSCLSVDGNSPHSGWYYKRISVAMTMESMFGTQWQCMSDDDWLLAL